MFSAKYATEPNELWSSYYNRKEKERNQGPWCWHGKGELRLLLSNSYLLTSLYRVAVGWGAQVTWPWTLPKNSSHIYRISKTIITLISNAFLVFGLFKNSSLGRNRWVNKEQQLSNWFSQSNVNPEWKSGWWEAITVFYINVYEWFSLKGEFLWML